MKVTWKFGLAGLAALMPMAACAQSAPPAPVATSTPAPVAADQASQVALKVFPEGTYRKIMSGSLNQMMDKMLDQMSSLPVRDLAQFGGVDPAKVEAMDKTSIADIMAIMDPAFKERSQIMMKTMFAEMIPLMEKYEPAIRDGLADVYRQRFTPAQLTELSAFFATPTGSAFASQQMLMYTDPAVMNKMQAFLPDFMQAMPGIMKKVQDATAGLPKPRKPEELTPADRAKLCKLFGATGKTPRCK